MSTYAPDQGDAVHEPVPGTRVTIVCATAETLYDEEWREELRESNPSCNICLGPEECECKHPLMNGKRPYGKSCSCWCHEQVIDCTKKERYPR